MIGARRNAVRTWAVAIVTVLAGVTSAEACSALSVDSGRDKASAVQAGHRLEKKRKGSGSLRLVAAPVGQTRGGTAGVTPGVATFRPARPGRTVLIQRKVGHRWKTVTKGSQNRKGQFNFTVTKATSSYRAVAAATKKDAKVVTKAARSARWRQQWGDEFTGSGPLNPAIWSTLKFKSEGKFACAEVLSGNAYRQGGAAVLRATRLTGAAGAKTAQCKTGRFGNALVEAKNPKHHVAYGIAAARVKFAPVRGLHSGFWLNYVGDPTPGDPRTGTEIDVAEYFGDGRPNGGLARYVHWYDKNNNVQSLGGEFASRGLLPKKKEWSQGWHVYSVEWTPTSYTFRVDGVVTLTTSRSVSRSPEKVLLSVITSDWEIPQLKVYQLPTATKYDWVRVWKRPRS